MQQSFYVYNNGDLKRKDNTLRFTSYDGEKRDIPIERISDIYVMSEMSFNTTFLSYISQYGIPIHFFNYYNFYTGSFYPKESNLAGQLKELNYLHLKKDASKLIVSEFEKKMKQTIMHKELGRQVSYQYLIRLEAYKLIKHLIGEKEYEGFRIWW